MIARDQGPRENAERSSQTQMPESLKVPEELAAIQQALDAGPTPGNWSSLTNRGGTSFLILDSEKRLVCSMSWHSSSREHYPLRAESAANSAVIAACNPAAMTAVLSHISALQSALKDRDAEIERLKKDAERYRWLREQEWFNGELCVLREPKRVLTRGIGLGADCPSHDRLDAAIDSMKGDANG